jgi:hypothetical protein
LYGVQALRLTTSLWLAVKIDSMDGELFSAGMGVPW